ncbi:hypothetical protein DSO57_1034817 [Entomophthora muscae]|uniref:Uncharacterized protein n=1 Tax=Entomophthora muscae TaxID=34485 RepID=A0ACC2U8Q0_9FUNG|nr:hypothetical protein DSO57_1034817 [Entomophthora muscae]
MNVRINNYSSLETRARELESNPKPRSLWTNGPVDCRTTCPRFSGIEPPQADTKHINPCSRKSQTKGIIAPNGGLITAPNGGTNLATISFINLNSKPATNQEQTQERGTGLRPGPMTCHVIVRPSKKAQKVGKPVSKLIKLTDLNQMVNQKWVTAAPVCQLKPAPL